MEEPKDHLHDCNFWCLDTNGFSSKSMPLLVYLSLDSARRPVPHDTTLPILVPPEDPLISVHDTSDNSEVESCGEGACKLDANFMCLDDNYAPQLLSQKDLNDLVRDLVLTKEKAELLPS